MRFIPYKKLSKRKKRELDNEQRATWGLVKPFVRMEKNGKAYDRKRGKRIEQFEE